MSDETIRKDLAAARRDLGKLDPTTLDLHQTTVVNRLIRILDWGDRLLRVEEPAAAAPKAEAIGCDCDPREAVLDENLNVRCGECGALLEPYDPEWREE